MFKMRKTGKKAFIASVVATVVCSTSASADENGHHGEHGHHGPNIFEVFVGGTFEDHHGKSEEAVSAGVQYRYAFNNTVSVGVLAEYSASPLNHWIVGIPAVFTLGGSSWQLTAMPGLEFTNSKEKFLFRTGLGYEFELPSGTSVKPEVNLDWVNGDVAVVAGVSFGWRF